jgi:DNA repair ATPase RecN
MSLQRISLRDIVIVRQLDLDFSAGFGVLSGETGAGKSILVDALQLVLGARADASVVREGASRTEAGCLERGHIELLDLFTVIETLQRIRLTVVLVQDVEV